jgi:hypothetical protein
MEEERSYFASLANLELRTWEASGRYCWTVKDSSTGDEIGGGEAADLASAMIAAAQVAGAEWGAVRWRSSGDDS